MDEFDEDYFELGDAPPHLVLEMPDKFEAIRGKYAIGLSKRKLDQPVVNYTTLDAF
jgi:hypothetical protein